MSSILKYRILALTLVVIFGLFNVGIPVIIATCSMPQMMSGGSCPMCDEQERPTSATFATAQGTQCCSVVVVAERNTNEFVNAKSGVADPGALVAPVADFNPIPLLPHGFAVVRVSSSPPHVPDIPILTSSLLI
jgi:hypothetical protein